MKTTFKLLLIGITVFFHLVYTAQVSGYLFSQSSGTYNAVSGGTVLGNNTSDDQVFVDPAVLQGATIGASGPGFAIGFNFTFNGTVYDRIGVSNDGWIFFGLSSMGNTGVNSNSSSGFTGISATSTAPGILQNRVAALSRDIQGQASSSLRIETIGTAPSRTLVVQYSNYRKYNATGDNFNFQIRLVETLNSVEVIYGTFVNNATASSAEVGLRGTSNADFNNRVVTNANAWATSVAGAFNTSVASFNNTGLLPSSGQVYRWIAPTPCVGAPAANTSTANLTVICPGTWSNLYLVNTYTHTGLSYQWFASTTSSTGPFTSVSNGTTASFISTGINANTWYQTVITCSNGPASSTTIPIKVNVVGTTTNSVPYNEGFEGLILNNQLPNCSWSASNLPMINQTYTLASTNNRMPHTGNKFASFRFGTNVLGDYFYSNGIRLEAGVTYSAAVWYITDGNQGWSEFSLLYGASQSPTALTVIASVTGAVSGQYYQPLSNTFTVASSGLYYIAVKCVGNSIPQYLSFDDISVTKPCTLNSPTLAVNAPLAACVGETVNLAVSGAHSYSWNTGATGANINVVLNAGTWFTVTGTNTLSSCSSSITHFVSAKPSPVLSIFANPLTVCPGKTTTLQAGGADTYTWNPGGMNSPTIAVAPTVSTVYSLSGTNSQGCEASANKFIGVHPAVVVTAGASGVNICVGESVTLTATGALSYTWKSLNLYSELNPVIIWPLASAGYTVTGHDINGCEGTAWVMISANACIGIEGPLTLSAVKIYPNPGPGIFKIETPEGEKTIKVMDVSGRIIFTTINRENSLHIDLSDFADGFYFVRINSVYSDQIFRIIKAR